MFKTIRQKEMKYEVKELTPFRLLSIYAYDAIKKGHKKLTMKTSMTLFGCNKKNENEQRKTNNSRI